MNTIKDFSKFRKEKMWVSKEFYVECAIKVFVKLYYQVKKIISECPKLQNEDNTFWTTIRDVNVELTRDEFLKLNACYLNKDEKDKDFVIEVFHYPGKTFLNGYSIINGNNDRVVTEDGFMAFKEALDYHKMDIPFTILQRIVSNRLEKALTSTAGLEMIENKKLFIGISVSNMFGYNKNVRNGGSFFNLGMNKLPMGTYDEDFYNRLNDAIDQYSAQEETIQSLTNDFANIAIPEKKTEPAQPTKPLLSLKKPDLVVPEKKEKLIPAIKIPSQKLELAPTSVPSSPVTTSDQTVTLTATLNVTPKEAAQYKAVCERLSRSATPITPVVKNAPQISMVPGGGMMIQSATMMNFACNAADKSVTIDGQKYEQCKLKSMDVSDGLYKIILMFNA